MDFSKLSDQELEKIAGGSPQKPQTDFSALSDEELERIAGGGATAKPEPTSSAPLAAVRNFVQGATANFSDEVAGGVEAAGRALGVKGLGVGDIRDVSLSDDGPTVDWQILKEAYRRARDQERSDLKRDKKERPVLSGASQLAGAIASPINKIAPHTTLAKSGAIIGGVTGLGGSEADSVGGALLDTATGAVVGGTVGKVIDKASPLLKKGAEKIGDTSKTSAEWLSARAQGLERGTAKKLGSEKVKEIGRQGLDKGLLNLRDNADDMIANNQAIKSKAMDARRAAYDLIDEKGASSFNPLEVAAKVEQKLLGGKNRNHDDVKELAAAIEPHLSNILSRGEGNISMKAAQDLVNSFSKKAKFDSSRSTLANDVAKDVYHIVRDSINESAEKAADKLGTPGLRKLIEQSNKTFFVAKNAEKLLSNKQARETGNKIFGLTDTIAGGAGLSYGALTGDWENAVGLVLAKKGLEKYGSKLGAKALDRVAKSFASTPNAAKLIQGKPGLFGAIVKGLTPKPSTPLKAADKGAPMDGDSAIADIRGENKWSVDGYARLLESDKSGRFSDEALTEKLFSSKKGKSLLAQASAAKPGSKAFEKIKADIIKFGGEK